MSTQNAGVVVIGAGQAASQCADALRQSGYDKAITLIGDEDTPPYRRPPLSKTFLAGTATVESLIFKPLPAYEKQNVQCRVGVRADRVDRATQRVHLSNGEALPYEHLVFATGGRARELALPGAALPHVHSIREIGDVQKLRARFSAGKKLVIIGGGYIGLEVAAVAIQQGLHVTVLEAQPRVLARVTAPELSAFYESAHRKRGVVVRTDIALKAIEADAVVLADGERVAADTVIVGVGLLPCTELAADAGLAVSNGIAVNAQMRTADPQVYAIGDCANYEHGFLGQRVRLESVPNALETARAAAAAITGKPAPVVSAPWFWSDQYDLKLQMVGLSQGYDRLVLRGDPATESFCAFYLRDGVLIAADSVNRSADFLLAKKWVGARARLPAEALADASTDLKTLAG